MWLTDSMRNEKDYESDDDRNKKEGTRSPPLEGGEAPYEILIGARTYLEHNVHVQLLTQLHSLFDDRNFTSTDKLRDIFPTIQGTIPDIQLHDPNLISVFESDQIPHSTFTHTFLQSILSSVDSKDPIVSNAWLETLLDVIELLPKDVIKKEILSLAVAKGQLSQPVHSKLSCCRLLGKICCKFEPYMIKKEILPVVQSLCQDVEHEVRACMCRQLDLVAKGIGLEAIKNSILPELVELANDETGSVRLAAIETVVQILSLLDDETCVQIIVPLVKNICDSSIRLEDMTLPLVAKQLGKLCHGLSVNLMSDQKLWFLDYYRRLSKLGYLPIRIHLNEHASMGGCNPSIMPDIVPRLDTRGNDQLAECRLCCAFNFPAMTLFAGPENFEQHLYDAFHSLANDPYIMVRRTIACGIHEVARLLGSHVHFIVGELISLLQDDSLEVIEGIVEHLQITLETLAKESGIGISERRVEEVLVAVMECEETVSKTSNWRLHSQILEKLSCLPKCLSSAVIFHQFIPIFFQKLFTVRPIPCRIAAASTLLILLRSNPRQDQKQQLCSRLVEELCQGRSCHSRMLFITICELVMNIFSKSFFKEYFFLPLLRLSEDPVPNVRLRLCKVIPQMKTVLKFPGDKELLQELETCVGKLMIDEDDSDVSFAVKLAIMDLDKIEIPTDPYLNSTRHGTINSSMQDIEDKRKEAEERRYMDSIANRTINCISQVQHSSDHKTTKTLGRIPVRTSLIGNGMTQQKIGESISLNKPSSRLSVASGLSLNKTDSVSIKLVEPISRIPMLTRHSNTSDRVPKRYTSPPRPASSIKTASLSKTIADSPIPSPESIRRANQGRRKSLGPGTLVFSSTLPRANLNSNRLSGVDSKSASNSPTHIPRYRSSLSFLSDHDRLESLLLYPDSPSDYISTFSHINQIDLSITKNPSHNSLSQLSDGYNSEQISMVDSRNVTHGGGGDKMFPFWSRNHKPRCTTPPVFEPQLGTSERGRRISRSASSSPTPPPLSLPKSSIPRYVGSNRTSVTLGSPSRTRTNIRSDTSNYNCTRAKSSSQLTPPTSPWRKTAPSPQSNTDHRWTTKSGRASSLPGTPRSISPTTANILRNSVLELNRRSIGWKSVQQVDRTKRFSSSSAGNGTKSVRNMVKELESLSKSSAGNYQRNNIGWRRKSDENLISVGCSNR